MPASQITVYGAHWCPDCRRAKKFLGEQFVSYQWVDIEQDRAGEQTVLQLNHGKRIIPTIVFADGTILAEPSNAELARRLGLNTEARQRYYDLVIVGGGPAGLTAGIYAAREGVETLIIERSGLGGQAAITGAIDNFPGFPEGITGQDLADRMSQQAARFGVELLQAQDVTTVCEHDGYRCAILGEGQHVHAKAVLITSGATYQRLGVPGEDDFIGAGIHFCATCDGPFYRGAAEIVVVGGGNSAVEEALHLTAFAETVTLLVRGDRLTASQIAVDKVTEPDSRVEVRYRTVVEAFAGSAAQLREVAVRRTDTGVAEVLRPAAAFVFIGQRPNTDFVRDRVTTDAYGFIRTGHDLMHVGGVGGEERLAFETSLPGVFAAGDVRHGSVKQVASAVGEGAAAAIAIREYLREQ
jgi:thioredoxin reductase (NADPH)